MPKFLLKRWHGYHVVAAFVLIIVLTGVLFVFQWQLGVTALVLCAFAGFYSLQAEQAFRRDLNRYIGTISHRVKKKAGNEVIQELPLGILIYDEEKLVQWHNPFVAKMLEKASVIGESLYEVMPMLKKIKKGRDVANYDRPVCVPGISQAGGAAALLP